jgi:hypothetical protein
MGNQKFGRREESLDLMKEEGRRRLGRIIS